MSDLRFILPTAVFLLITIYLLNSHHKEVDSYVSRIDSLERIIVDKESDIEILTNELELREMEISYLGHSLDSVKYNIKP